MFLLMNKVYLKDDSEVNQRTPLYKVISRTLSHRFPEDDRERIVYNTVDEMISVDYNGSVDDFFEEILIIPDVKQYIYCDQKAFQELQIIFLKSIYGEDKADIAWLVYSTYMDFVNSKLNIWYDRHYDPALDRSEYKWKRLDETMFKAIFNKSPMANTIDYTKIGIEYLYPYGYVEGDHPLKEILLDRVIFLIKRKIYRELCDLKESILRHGYLITSNTPWSDLGIDLKPGQFRSELLKSDKLFFLVDDNFRLSNIEYCIENYKLEDLRPLYNYVLTYSRARQEIHEKMDELIANRDPGILELDYKEGRLSRLINCFSDTRVNNYLLSYFILLAREGRKEELLKFLLRE